MGEVIAAIHPGLSNHTPGRPFLFLALWTLLPFVLHFSRKPVCFPNLVMLIVFPIILRFNVIVSKLSIHEHPEKMVSIKSKLILVLKKKNHSHLNIAIE